MKYFLKFAQMGVSQRCRSRSGRSRFFWLEPEAVFLAGAVAVFVTRLRLWIQYLYYVLAEEKSQLHEQSQEKS